jgi:putative transcriptional regulator
MNYAQLCKKIRDKLLLTQTEFAKLLGVSITTVCRWENNVFAPTMKAKRKIVALCRENNIETEAK